MAKPEWGIKRICSSCKTKYYDLNKAPIICPSCGTEFDPDYYLKTKKSRGVLSKVSSENDNDLSSDIDNIDDIEVDSDSEVVSDDDPLLEINKDDQSDIAEDEIGLDDNITFIEDDEVTDEDLGEDDEVSDENGINVEISEEDKK